MHIPTKTLEARLEHLRDTLRWQETGSPVKVDAVNEIACIYQLLIDLAKETLAIQKEWNRGNY